MKANRKKTAQFLAAVKEKIPNLCFSQDLSEILAASGDLTGLPLHHWRWKREDAVLLIIWPSSPEEVAKIISIARQLHIPLVPRGGGTGYSAGSSPAAGGVIIDLKRLNNIVVDKSNTTLRVQAGATLARIDEVLAQSSLELGVYPTSSSAVTIGGWLTGSRGIGCGSVQKGTVFEEINEINLVDPQGTNKIYRSLEECTPIYGSNGIFGIITDVVIHIHPRKTIIPLLIGYSQLMDLLAVIEEIRPLPGVHTLKVSNAVLERSISNNIPHELNYCLLVGISEEKGQGDQSLAIITKAGYSHHGTDLGSAAAQASWAGRYTNELMPKKHARVLMIQQLYLHISDLSSLITAAQQKSEKYRLEFGFSGMLAKSGYMRLVLYAPTDNANWLHFLASKGFLHQLVGVAYRLGNSNAIYDYGLINTLYLHKFEPLRLKKLSQVKQKVDSTNIMNPYNQVASVMKYARIDIMFRLMLFGQRWAVKRNRLSPLADAGNKSLDFNQLIKQCATCSYCRESCPTYITGTKESAFPGGKIRAMRSILEYDLPIQRDFIDLLYYCTTCKNCESICPIEFPFVNIIELARASTMQRTPVESQPHAKIAEKIHTTHNAYGENPATRDSWNKNSLVDSHLKLPSNLPVSVAYFIGCTPAFRVPETASHTFSILTRILKQQPAILGAEEFCCGSPLIRTGLTADVKDLVNHNLKALGDLKILKVVFSCAGCYNTATHDWPKYSPQATGFQFQHITEFIADAITQGLIRFKPWQKLVTYHDPCHLGRHLQVYDTPRAIIQAIPKIKFVEMPHARENAVCCGAGGGFRVAFPNDALEMGKKRLQEARETGAEILITACPFCKSHFQLVANEFKIPLTILCIEDLVHDLLE